MGILGRINRVIKSNVNELIDKMSDPAKEVDLLIVEMQEGLKKAREEVITATATAKRAEMDTGRLDEESQRWQQRAEQAVRAGDDELAREALRHKATGDQALATARRTVQEQRAYVDELMSSLKALEARLKDVELRKESLKQRARAAKEGDKGLSGAKAFADFDRLEAKIEAMEETTEFAASLDQRDLGTAAKFRELEKRSGDPKVDDELAELKRRLERGEG